MTLQNFQNIEDLSLTDYKSYTNDYQKRRQYFQQIADSNHNFWLNIVQPEYNQEEQEIWTLATQKLQDIHSKYACESYLKGKKILGLNSKTIVNLETLNQELQKMTQFRFGQTIGFVYAEYFEFLAKRVFHASILIRPKEHLFFGGKEPDLIHEVIGHAPGFLDRNLADLSQIYGLKYLQTDEAGKRLLEKLYYKTVEFGLVKENDQEKAYGASILSSSTEILRVFESGQVKRIQPSLDWVLQDSDQDYSDFKDRVVLFDNWEDFYSFSHFCLNSLS